MESHKCTSDLKQDVQKQISQETQLGSAERSDSESRGPIAGFGLNMAAFPRVREREACDFESLGLIEGSVSEQEHGSQEAEVAGWHSLCGYNMLTIGMHSMDFFFLTDAV